MAEKMFKEKEALDILCQLIRIRTLLPRGDELDLIKYIITLFDGADIEKNIINHQGNRASLILKLPGKNSNRSIGFVGHLDTFPILGAEKWEHAPFSADYEGGKVYGRGSANMKGGITAMLLAFLYFIKNGITPPCDISLCLTAGGDDAGLMGARSLTASGALNCFTEMIFGEPTDNKIGIAQRGGIWLSISVTGRASYACIPGVGIDSVATFIDLHKKISSFINKEKYFHPHIGTPLCTITQICGGVAINSIAPSCEGTIDIRLLPLQDNEEVIQYAMTSAEDIEKRYESLRISVVVEHSNITVAMPPDARIVKDFEKILERRGESTKKTGLFYYTDACAMIPTLGIPFIFFGPGKDVYNIPQDESIDLDSVIKAAEVYVEYLMHCV